MTHDTTTRPFRTRTGFLALCERETLRILKIWTQTIAAPVVTAMLFLAVFGVSLGTRVGDVDGVSYVTYILPGIVLMQIATMAYNNNASSVFQARSDGYIEDVLASPMHAWQMSVALLWGGVLRSLLIASIVTAIAMIFTPVTILHPVRAVAIAVVTAILWASIGTIAGIYAKSWDHHTLIANLVITPLVFVGGVFYSVAFLPDALARVTAFNPLFWQVNALRETFLGISDTPFAQAAALTVGVSVIAFSAQLALFRTGRRLKE